MRLEGHGAARVFFFFSSRRRHTRLQGDWSSDVCSSDLPATLGAGVAGAGRTDLPDRGGRGASGGGPQRVESRQPARAVLGLAHAPAPPGADRERGGEGKRGGLGGRRIIKKKKERSSQRE